MNTKFFAILKDVILIVIMGLIYREIEVLWRGRSSWTMVIVGGLCAFLIGRLNQREAFYNRRMWEQCLIGVCITLVIEFVSGLIINKVFNMGVWDYSDLPGNIMGQICIPYAILWYAIMPFTIYVDDFLRYLLFKEPKPQGLIYNYKLLFAGL
jgi:hypothetical protein